MHNKIEILRWFLVIPSAFAGWYAALFISIFLYAVADTVADSLCPPELMSSRGCQASWHDPLIDGLVIFGSSLSAVFVVMFSVLVAPKKRILVAKVIYIGGAIFALYAVYETSAWGAFFGTIISGAFLIYFLNHYLKGKKSA
jgi:hypothetical protein